MAQEYVDPCKQKKEGSVKRMPIPANALNKKRKKGSAMSIYANKHKHENYSKHVRTECNKIASYSMKIDEESWAYDHVREPTTRTYI